MLVNQEYLRRYLLAELKPIFQLKYLREDSVAAIAVAIVAIPLSLAISLATGVGAEVGLISAVIGGILGALFGGSRLSVTGPAVAMSVLLAGILDHSGFAGLLVVGVVCGVLQIMFGLFKLGRIAKYIPLPLVLAFTAGIGFLLFFDQLPQAFQLSHQHDNTITQTFNHWQLYASHLSSAGFLLTVLTLAILACIPYFLPRAYAFLLAMLIPSLIAHWFNLPVWVVGQIPHNLVHPEIIDFTTINNLSRLILAGCEVFMLASLETLLSTNAVDLMGKGDLNNSNQELVGQGIANIGVAICGGIPVTGIIARSSVNVLAGAKTRRAAILHSLIILAVVYFVPSIIEQLPIAVLAGILLAASFKMMNVKQVIELWQSDRLDFLVYLVTFSAIIGSDLIDGIQLGLLLAFVIVGIRMLQTRTDIKLWTNNHVLRVGMTGNLTFLSYDKLATILEFVKHTATKFVIIEFAEVQHLDANGARHLFSLIHDLAEINIQTILHGMNDEQQIILRHNSLTNKPNYSVTVAEYQIKEILEQSGINHLATDVLRHGIIKYISHYAKDNQQLLTTLAKGQKPHTLLITCSDSRLNPNAFFSANIGEIFIVRNVGNVVPPYSVNNVYSEIAAIEYAIAELEVRNIVICAHTECGAVKASFVSGDNKLGHIGLDNWLGIIKDGFKLNPPDSIEHGIQVNLLYQVVNLKTYPQVQTMLANGQLTINAWIYDVHSGTMLEWSEQQNNFIAIN
ncbi:MAG: hypothetical protein RLZZ293_1115 [Pseudomonadota bacterium]|jgi:carbonic anhydrase